MLNILDGGLDVFREFALEVLTLVNDHLLEAEWRAHWVKPDRPRRGGDNTRTYTRRHNVMQRGKQLEQETNQGRGGLGKPSKIF